MLLTPTTLLWALGGGGTLRSSLARGRSRRCPRLLRCPPQRPRAGGGPTGTMVTPAARRPLLSQEATVARRPALPPPKSTRGGPGARGGRRDSPCPAASRPWHLRCPPGPLSRSPLEGTVEGVGLRPGCLSLCLSGHRICLQKPQSQAGSWGSLQGKLRPPFHTDQPRVAQCHGGAAPGWTLSGPRADRA